MAVLDYVAEHHQGQTEGSTSGYMTLQQKHGGIPAPLNYEGFPKSVCTSINDQVCHGIPSGDVVLKDGDIINVDVSTILHGYFSDSSRMFPDRQRGSGKEKLVRVTNEAVEKVLNR